jgi:hypothetical protein
MVGTAIMMRVLATAEIARGGAGRVPHVDHVALGILVQRSRDGE